MAARMTWICHAATALRGADFPADEPLDDKGRSACTAAVRSFRRTDRSWTAPERRAIETAEALGLTAGIAPELRDCDLGRWAGRPVAEIGMKEPDAFAQWLADPAAAPHGGESTIALMQRVGAWLDARDDDSGHSIVVTHPAVIRAAIVHVLGAGAASFARIDVALLSRAVFTRAGKDWRFRALGEGIA